MVFPYFIIIFVIIEIFIIFFLNFAEYLGELLPGYSKKSGVCKVKYSASKLKFI